MVGDLIRAGCFVCLSLCTDSRVWQTRQHGDRDSVVSSLVRTDWNCLLQISVLLLLSVWGWLWSFRVQFIRVEFVSVQVSSPKLFCVFVYLGCCWHNLTWLSVILVLVLLPPNIFFQLSGPSAPGWSCIEVQCTDSQRFLFCLIHVCLYIHFYALFVVHGKRVLMMNDPARELTILVCGQAYCMYWLTIT